MFDTRTFSMLPDFAEGLAEGMQAFKDGIFFPEHRKIWTEDDIITLVNEELDGTRYLQMRRYEEYKGHHSLSYIHHLGFVVGYVHQAIEASYQLA